MGDVAMPHELYTHIPMLRCQTRADLPAQCGELRLIVGLAEPHRIEQVSPDLLDLFQLSAAQCIGRTMCVLSGPETQQETLMHLIGQAALGKQARAVVMLYSWSGAGERFCVHCRPYFSTQGVPAGVLLDMAPFKDSFNLKMATQDDGMAKAIIGVEAPHRTEFCSPEFEALYGLPGPCVVGRTLNLIHGPNTDQLTWRRLLAAAGRGVSESALLVTATSDCRELETTIKMLPIINAAGFISHVLVVATPYVSLDSCSPSEEDLDFALMGSVSGSEVCAPSVCTSDYSSCQSASPDVGHDTQGDIEYCLYQAPRKEDSGTYACGGVPTTYQGPSELNFMQDQAASTPLHPAGYIDVRGGHAPSVEFDPSYGMPVRMVDARMAQGLDVKPLLYTSSPGAYQHPTLPHDCPGARPPQGGTRPPRASGVSASTVIPRRKAGQDAGSAPAPVVITMETLEQYADVPLSKVATMLGISATAMKKACRRLGVNRWPYNSTYIPKAAIKAVNHDATHVDTAQVRKIFRKHAGGNAKITEFSFASLHAALHHPPTAPPPSSSDGFLDSSCA
jgi:hypothetical protein